MRPALSPGVPDVHDEDSRRGHGDVGLRDARAAVSTRRAPFVFRRSLEAACFVRYRLAVGRDDTTKEQALSIRSAGIPQPGIVLSLIGGKPAFRVSPIGTEVVLVGRGGRSSTELDDEHCSREHAEIRRTDEGVFVRDLGSRNGTFADGEPAGSDGRVATQTIRLGQSVLLVHPDVARLGGPHAITDPRIVTGPTLQDTFDLIADYAKHTRHLLILGETGAGKEFAARVFHDRGPCPTGPFRAVNTAEVSKELWESTLFGHRKGAFTGAHADQLGLFEATHGGTLFLDEIGELPIDVQPKLLRVLQEGEIRRVGDAVPRRVDVRVVAATNKDLHKAVGAGQFREDLYYRLGQNVAGVPPLRDRCEDIAFLIALGVAEFGLPIDATLVEACVLRPWPGNVRELLGAVRRAAIEGVRNGSKSVTASRLAPTAGHPMGSAQPDGRPVTPADRERAVVDIFRRQPGTHPNEVALRLGIDPRTVYRYLEKNGLKRATE